MNSDELVVVSHYEEALLSKRERWFGLIEEYKRTGGKRKDFCASRGLKPDHFNYYCKHHPPRID